MNKINNSENAIKRMLIKRPFGRVLLDNKIDNAASVKYQWDEILKYSTNSSFEYEYFDGELVGLIGFHISQYDTGILKKKTAIIKYLIIKESGYTSEIAITEALLNKFEIWVAKNNIEVVIARIDSTFFNSILVLQNYKYFFYETITYNTLSKSQVNLENLSKVEFRFADIEDLNLIKDLALRNTYEKSHFYLDHKFSSERVDLMYSKWIDNSFKSNDSILVIEEDSKIVGTFIYEIIDFGINLESKRAIWKSAFIDQKLRKRGLGKMLFKAALKACINDGAESIDSSLISKNIPSQNLHNYLNFKLVSVSYTFHKWFC